MSKAHFISEQLGGSISLTYNIPKNESLPKVTFQNLKFQIMK